MRRTGSREALGLLLLLGLLLPAAAQAQSAPEPAAASAANATSETATLGEEADDGGGHVASKGVCEPPTPVSPSRLQSNETSEGAAEQEAVPEPTAAPTAAEAGGITPPLGQQWEPALAANDTGPATNGTAPGGALAEDEAEQHNFALEKDGAKVVAANREAKKVQALLDDDSDTYLKNDCRAEKWFILELAQVAKVNRFELSQFELYSSRVREFEVRGRQSHPRTDGVEYSRGLDSPAWKLLGNYTAEKAKGTQSFGVDPAAWVRYLLLRFVSHYGTEPVCALNAFSVFGKSAAEELEDQLASEDPLDYLGAIVEGLEEPGASRQPAGNDSKLAEEGAAAPAGNASSSSNSSGQAPGLKEGSGEGEAPANPAQGPSNSSSITPDSPPATGPTESEGPLLGPTGTEEAAVPVNATQAGSEAEPPPPPQQQPASKQPPAQAGVDPAAGEVPAAEEAAAPADNATVAQAAAAAAAAVEGTAEIPSGPAAAEVPPPTGAGNASQPSSEPAVGDPPPELAPPEATARSAAAAAGKDTPPGAQPTPPQQPAAGNGGGGGNGGGAAAKETLEDLPLSMRPSKPKGSASIYEILVQEIKGAKVGQKLLVKGLADLQRNLTALQAETGAELAALVAQLSKLAVEAEAAAAQSEPDLNHRLEALVKSHLLEVTEDVRALQAAAAGVAWREHAALSLLAMLGAVFALSMPGFARDWPRVKLVVAALAVGNGLVGLLLHIRSSGALKPSLRALA